MRVIDHRYVDPLDQVWLETARRIGLAVVRSNEVYASTDGRGVLRLGTAETLDPDDCLAQMIYHELCHALIEGPEAFARPDWGLDNTSARDEVREHACLRLQAALSAEYGLRRVFAPTTDFRAFFDQLPEDPLAPRTEVSVSMACVGLQRADRKPWAPHLRAALEASATIANAVAKLARDDADSTDAGLLPLWRRVDPTPARHPTGFQESPVAARECGTCAWFYLGGRGQPVTRCRQAEGARVASTWRACARWEPALDCQTCGACCREAYHSVTVSRREPVVRRHPELVVARAGYVELRRVPTTSPVLGEDWPATRCAALEGDGVTSEYACRIYEDRPRPCRELAMGSAHCLTARRRVGLSR